MSGQLSLTLREHLQQENKALAETANHLWNKSRPIHERQNRPDSNENGRTHVEAVENNIWRLLQTTTLLNKANHLEDFSTFELFLLSCVACCHDFDKALRSALPDGFKHGEGSGDFVVENSEILGLSRPKARAVKNAIGIHDLPNDEFQDKLKLLKTDQGSPMGPYNLQRLTVLLKTADILHCDNSRILTIGIDSSKLEGIERKKYLSRYCTDGWKPDGRRIIIQGVPEADEEVAAFIECFEYMKKIEWPAVADALERYNFPYQLEMESDLTSTDGSQAQLEIYLKSIVAETRRIDIKGIFSRSGYSREAIQFPIEDIYTPLKTHQTRSGRESSTDLNEMAEKSDERIPLTDLLSKHRRLLIIGEPGGGKTTFLKLIACVLSKDALGRPKPEREIHLGVSLKEETPVPIFMRLAALAETVKSGSADVGCGGSWRHIVRAMDNMYGHVQSGMLQNLLSDGKCALLLDGLDEVAEENMRNRIVEVVNAVLERWGNNLIVLSSRPFGYHDIADLEQMATTHIDAFGEEEIVEFLNRWGQGLYPDKEERVSVGYLTELQSAIIKSSPIRRLARNPVMLTCLCVVHWNERKLPEGKADLLAAVLRWLLNAREENRKNRGYTSTFAEECFKALALGMTLHPQGNQVIVDLSWAADQLGIPFSDILGIVDEDRVRREGRRFLEEEMLDSGIVEKYGAGQLRFWHLNFQEHYAARALVDRSDDAWWKIVESRLYSNQFSEVLDHLAGCLAWTGLFRLNLLVEKILGTAREEDLTLIARAVGVLGRILRILAVYDYLPPARLGWQDAQDRVMKIFTNEGADEVPVTKPSIFN